jgi:hypothetical protein
MTQRHPSAAAGGVACKWRTKDEYATLVFVAHRPTLESFDRPLTPQDLAASRRLLAKLTTPQLFETFRQAYAECRMEGNRVPRAEAVQKMVTTWKVAWNLRRRRQATRD